MIRLLLRSYVVLFSIQAFCQSDLNASKLDSINNLITLSQNNDYSLEVRLNYAIQSSKLASKTNNDSIRLKSDRNLSLMYLNVEDFESYKNLNFQNLKLANKLNDSTAIAIATHNIAQYYYLESRNDSAYFYYSKAIKLYDQLKQPQDKAVVLMTIADIQETERDYIGSEENSIKAIKLFQNLPKSETNLDNLWILNNLVGIISLKLKLYDKSLEYHEKAMEISDEMDNGFYNRLYSLNNKAFVYRKKGDFKQALEIYYDLADQREKYDDYDPTFYPLVIDNIAFAKFLANHTDYDVMDNLFKEAYNISDRLGDDITKLAVSIDLSKFYLKLNKKDSSLKYANQAYKISKEISSNEIHLDALKVLSELKEGEEGKAYLNQHIKLSDSLLNVERNVRNKYARIELETDQLEAENQRISQQKLWLSALSIGLLVTLTLVYIIITQRAKNKELQFVQDQQKANEEIYNLMLSQQDKVDEARAGEKKRISEELHDGILGRLFGTRLSLDSLNFSEGKEAINNRAAYIKELMVIEQDIRKISHDLNTDFVAGSGFMDIVEELIEKQTKAYQLTYEFNFTDDINWEVVPNKTKINIYRVIQESLQNIYKHANANTVKISIELKKSVICLSISDDGDGFDINKSKKGIGLKNINSRVDELQGNVKFDSKINEGTTVHIEVPYLG